MYSNHGQPWATKHTYCLNIFSNIQHHNPTKWHAPTGNNIPKGNILDLDQKMHSLHKVIRDWSVGTLHFLNTQPCLHPLSWSIYERHSSHAISMAKAQCNLAGMDLEMIFPWKILPAPASPPSQHGRQIEASCQSAEAPAVFGAVHQDHVHLVWLHRHPSSPGSLAGCWPKGNWAINKKTLREKCNAVISQEISKNQRFLWEKKW